MQSSVIRNPGEQPSFAVKDIGKRRGSGWPSSAWVSKSDVVEFLRCKYRVFLAHKLNRPFKEFVESPAIKRIMERGAKFEDSILSQMHLKRVVRDIESVIGESGILLRSLKLFQNQDLGIRGVVDLIAPERGKLYPIEIKSHKTLSDSDRLELAFYWRLLEPLRNGRPVPKGYVWLNTGESVEVRLTKDDFARLDHLVEEVRHVKSSGFEQILSRECDVCTFQRECLGHVREKGGLTLIPGVGEIRQNELARLRIRTVQALAKADPDWLSREWRRLSSHCPGSNEIRSLQFRAKSWSERKPLYFGAPLPSVNTGFLVLDLEYDTSRSIWLVGVLVLDAAGERTYQLFADNPSEERGILAKLTSLLDKYPDYQVLTWSGVSAEIPQLEQAWGKYRLKKEDLSDLERRHLDLYHFVLNNCAFPLKSLGIKEVAGYLGFKWKHPGMDGWDALWMYHEYLNLPVSDKKRAEIKQELLEYNRDDLEAVLHTIRRLCSLFEGVSLTSSRRVGEVKRNPPQMA